MLKKILFFTILLFSFLACEKIENDVEPIDSTPIDDSEHVIYTNQGEEAIVDVLALQANKSISTLTIVDAPKYGKATFIDVSILSYQPDVAVVEAEDQITVEVKTQNNQIKKTTFFIKIKADDDESLCHSTAKPDKFLIEANKSQVFDVLKNDSLCDVTIDENSLKISLLPKNGKAQFKNKKIEFLPNPNFLKGNDYLVYEFLITKKDGKKEKLSASVDITIDEKNASGNPCVTKLNDDKIVVPANSPYDSIPINPLFNDKICNSGIGGTPLIVSIGQQPKLGKISISQKVKNILVYVLPKNNNDAFEDIFTYKITQNGVILEAEVAIKKLENNGSSNKNPKLIADNFTFSLSKSSDDLKKGYIFVNVFNNDANVGAVKGSEFSIKNEKSNGGKFEIEKPGLIRFTPQNKKFTKSEVSFTYEIIDSKKNKLSAEVLIKIVD